MNNQTVTITSSKEELIHVAAALNAYAAEHLVPPSNGAPDEAHKRTQREALRAHVAILESAAYSAEQTAAAVDSE